MLAVQSPGRTIIPTLRYRDVAAAVDWLCAAFGFERHLVVPGENGGVRYAELTFGDGMIMLGPVQDSPFDGLMMQPADAGGVETQICYLFVEDAGEHCARAKAAGAEIVLDIKEDDGGGRGYSCRDPEGHIWNFGTYNPWMRQPAPAGQVDPPERRSNWARGLRRVAAMAGLLVTMAGSALAVEWALSAFDWPSSVSQLAAVTSMRSDAPAKVEEMQVVRTPRETDERASDSNEQIAKECNAKEEALERDAHAAREQLAVERRAKEAAERRANEAEERSTLKERAFEAMQAQRATERNTREAAERQTREREERAKQVQKAAKERAAKDAQKRQRMLASRPQSPVESPAFPQW